MIKKILFIGFTQLMAAQTEFISNTRTTSQISQQTGKLANKNSETVLYYGIFAQNGTF